LFEDLFLIRGATLHYSTWRLHKMKKLVIFALILLIPAFATAGTISYEGSPSWYTSGGVGWWPDLYGDNTQLVSPGETWEMEVWPLNLASYSVCGGALDTFCVDMFDTSGWTLAFEYGGADEEGLLECFELPDLNYQPGSYTYVTVPCDAELGAENLATVVMVFCDVEGACQPDSGVGDCLNSLGYPQTMTQRFLVVAAPPALYVDQDTLFYVEEGVTKAYVPFGICNGDPCALPTNYGYTISNQGTVGGVIVINDVATDVPGGECQTVYGEVNASLATSCDFDTLTIIAWALDGSVYDTCVQAIHIVEPVPVPLFTAPVVTILVLAMILAAAVIMKRHAVSKA
jgi:hypothetical protein